MIEWHGTKVAQLANYVGPTSGGLRVVVEELGAEHLRRGAERLIVVPGPSDVRVSCGRERRVSIASPRLPGAGRSYHALIDRAAVLAELAAFAPAVIEVHDQTTLTWVGDWARKRRIATVLFSHERLDLVAAEVAGVPAGWLDSIGRRWAARLAHRFDAVVCASDFAADPFARGGAPNVHRIPFGVQLDQFTPSSRAAAVPPWSEGALRLIFVGRLYQEKAPDVALDVLDRLPESAAAELVMVGTGTLDAELLARVHRDGLPVHFAGHLSDRRQVADLLAAADVALSPGPRETFGLGVLEALAAGTPVVASDQGASGELLRHGGGHAVRDVDSMALSVLALASDPQASVLARRAAERYSWQATFDAVLALEQTLVAAGRPDAGRRRRRGDLELRTARAG